MVGAKTPSRTFSDEEIIKALTESKGLVQLAAKSLGCSRRCIYDRIKDVPEVAEALADSRELIIDEADRKLQELVQQGHFQAIALVLQTLGKKRGYGAESTVNVNGKIETSFNLDSLPVEDLAKVWEILGKADTNPTGN